MNTDISVDDSLLKILVQLEKSWLFPLFLVFYTSPWSAGAEGG